MTEKIFCRKSKQAGRRKYTSVYEEIVTDNNTKLTFATVYGLQSNKQPITLLSTRRFTQYFKYLKAVIQHVKAKLPNIDWNLITATYHRNVIGFTTVLR